MTLEAPSTRPQIQTRRGKILIVEDEFNLAMALAVRLENAGHEVVFASDSAMGVEGILADREKPDLILLDVMLPGEGGLWVAERLSLIEETRDIPIVFMTGSSQPGLREKAMELGAAAFFRKPYEAAELLDTIDHVLSRPRTRTIARADIRAALDEITWLHPETGARA